MNPFSLPYDCLSDYEWLGQQSLAPVKLSRIIQNVDDFFSLVDSSYSESQDHSQVIDDLFGFRIEAIEQKIAAQYSEGNSDWEGCEVWHQLNPRQLQTPL